MLTFFPVLTFKFNLAKMPKCAEFDEEIYVVFKEVCYVLKSHYNVNRMDTFTQFHKKYPA